MSFSAAVREAPEAQVIARRARRAEARQVFGRAVIKFVAAAAVIVVLFTLLFGVVRVRGTGMEPSAGDGDLALIWRLSKEFEADELVVYQDDSGQVQVGRVVAQPGDTVDATDDGQLLVNGTAMPSRSGEVAYTADGGPSYPLTLGEGEYFVVGDGRMSATDSRELGPIGTTEVEGKVIALLRLRGI